MHYYQRHIGDYVKDTAHLSLLEHGVYAKLLDLYYLREAPIPADQAARLVGARSQEERESVEQVLREFFVLTDAGWTQKRCDSEIERYHSYLERQSANGKAGAAKVHGARLATAKPPLEPSPSHRQATAIAAGQPDADGCLPNHEPLTINHKPLLDPPTPRKRGERRCPDSFELTPELLALSAELPADFDLDGETRKFRDHEFQKARTDWPACWRSWMRNARDRKSYAKRAASAPTIRQPPTPEAISAAREAAARQNVAQLAKVMPRLA